MRNIYKEVEKKYKILESSLRISSKALSTVYLENKTIKPTEVYLESQNTNLITKAAFDQKSTAQKSIRADVENPVVQNMSIKSVSAENKIGDVNDPNVEEVSVESIRDVEELLNDQVVIEKIDGDIVTECGKNVSNKLSVAIEANLNLFNEQELNPPESTLVRKRKRFSSSKINS